MIETLTQLGILDYVLASLGVSCIGIAWVYVFGVMLGFVQYWRFKNVIAIIAMVYSTAHYMLAFGDLSGGVVASCYRGMVIFAVAIMLYTLVMMRLRERADKLLDRRIGEDDGDKYKKTDRRLRK